MSSSLRTHMHFNFQCLLQALLIFVLAASAHGATWEETDGRYFEEGNLGAVKRLLSKETYTGDRLIDAFRMAAWSGNVDLVKYLEQRGWGNVCRKQKSCDPVNYAVLSGKHPKMVAHLLSRGFRPTRSALFSASAQVAPDDEHFFGSLESVKLLCENGANPEEKSKYMEGSAIRVGPTVLEELEERISETHMDLGTPLRDARGVAAEVKVAEFFKKGACKKGAAASTEFDDFLAVVQAMRHGAVVAESLDVLDEKHLSHQLERYLLYEAIASGNVDLLDELKNRNWISRCRNNLACRPIDVAAEVGADLKIFQLLVSEGFEIDGHNASGGTPLMYATLNAQVDAVRFLCEHGADYRKRVKLEIHERSLISIVRRSYSSAWCSAVFGGAASAFRDDVRLRCGVDDEGFAGPQSWISIPECVPGAECLSVSFPPRGSEKHVRQLKALADIFHYFKDGYCQPTACPSGVTAQAALIGGNVHLRAGPSMHSEKVDTLPFGTVVNVLDRSRMCESASSRKGRWIKIKVHEYSPYLDQREPKAEGWVFDAYVDYFPTLNP